MRGEGWEGRGHVCGGMLRFRAGPDTCALPLAACDPLQEAEAMEKVIDERVKFWQVGPGSRGAGSQDGWASDSCYLGSPTGPTDQRCAWWLVLTTHVHAGHSFGCDSRSRWSLLWLLTGAVQHVCVWVGDELGQHRARGDLHGGGGAE